MPSRTFLVSALLTLALTSISARAASPTLDKPSRDALLLQLSLESAGFSPGILDAKPGPKTTLALREFQKAHNLPVTARLDDATRAKLSLDPTQILATYTITDEDRAFVTGKLPTNWNDKAKLKRLGYESFAELVCERAHCTQALLSRLNPATDLARLRPGDTLTVPNGQWQQLPRAARLEINLSQKVIRCYNASNRVTALFHCSIAREAAKRPSGSATVVAIAENPTYHFDPDMWPEVKNVKSNLLLQPGPNNPVGLCWISISRKGYGIHGTPNPELIGKTGSHGCFRLANWDAQRLGRIVQPGTPITFVR